MFLPCFDTVDWMAGRTCSQPVRNLFQSLERCCLWDSVETGVILEKTNAVKQNLKVGSSGSRQQPAAAGVISSLIKVKFSHTRF